MDISWITLLREHRPAVFEKLNLVHLYQHLLAVFWCPLHLHLWNPTSIPLMDDTVNKTVLHRRDQSTSSWWDWGKFINGASKNVGHPTTSYVRKRQIYSWKFLLILIWWVHTFFLQAINDVHDTWDHNLTSTMYSW